MFQKIFTPEEANSLIPHLDFIFRRLHSLIAEIREHIEELDNDRPYRQAEELTLQQIIQRHPELEPKAREVASLVAEIEQHGCLLKDIHLGLVDFPGEVEGEVVFLCWQFGEPQVVSWHPLEGGFAQRRPLPGAQGPTLN